MKVAYYRYIIEIGMVGEKGDYDCSSSSSSSEGEEERGGEKGKPQSSESGSDTEAKIARDRAKRRARVSGAAESQDSSSDSDSGMVGPALSEAQPKKRKRVLQYENVFLDNLDCLKVYYKAQG